jgi:hypothetical protein
MIDPQDTPDLSVKWCPTCEPKRDPTREILSVQYCVMHDPDRTGDADSSFPAIDSFGTHLGASESEGTTNKFFSDALKKIEKDRKK